VHNPDSGTNVPHTQTSSVWLEGESNNRTSLHVEPTDVKAVDVSHDVEGDHDTQQSPRDPVGTPDSDTRSLNKPTKPPGKEEGADGRNGEVGGTSRVETVESNLSSQADKVGYEGYEGNKLKEGGGEKGGENEGNGGH
jgi:hypothetical protein